MSGFLIELVLGLVLHEFAHLVAAKRYKCARSIAVWWSEGVLKYFFWGPCITAYTDGITDTQRSVLYLAPLLYAIPGPIAAFAGNDFISTTCFVAATLTFFTDVPAVFGLSMTGTNGQRRDIYKFTNRGFNQ